MEMYLFYIIKFELVIISVGLLLIDVAKLLKTIFLCDFVVICCFICCFLWHK